MAQGVDSGTHRAKSGSPAASPVVIFGGKRPPKYHIGSGTLTIDPRSKMPVVPEHGKFREPRGPLSNSPKVFHGKGAVRPAVEDTSADAAEESDKANLVARRTLSSPIIGSPLLPPESAKPKILKPKQLETYTIRSLNDFFRSKGVDKPMPAKSWELTTSSLVLDALILEPAEIEAFPEELPPVVRLSLFKCWMSNAQFIALMKRIGGTLKELYVDFCFELTAEALKILPPLVKFEAGTHPPFNDALFPLLLASTETLQHLSCVGSAITDEGLAAAAPRFVNLVTIDVSSCNISGKGFLALAAIPLLRKATITGCAISEADIAEFYRRNPDAKIFRHYEMCPRPPELEPPPEPATASRKPLRRAHTASSLLDPPRLRSEIDDFVDEVDRTTAPTEPWSSQPSILSAAEKKTRARAYLKEHGMLDAEEEALLLAADAGDSKRASPPLSGISSALVVVHERRNSIEDDVTYSPQLSAAPTYGRISPPPSDVSALMVVPQLKRRGSNEDVTYSPQLSAAPSYQRPSMKQLLAITAASTNGVEDSDSDEEDSEPTSSRPVVTELPDDVPDHADAVVAPDDHGQSHLQQALVVRAKSPEEEDVFYAPPTQIIAPEYAQRLPDLAADHDLGGVYHADPSRDDAVLSSSGPRVNSGAAGPVPKDKHESKTASGIGRAATFTAGDRALFQAVDPQGPAPALLMAVKQRVPPAETPVARATAALQRLPLICAVVKAKEFGLEVSQPAETLLPQVRTELQIRNAVLIAQNMEAIAVSGNSDIRQKDTGIINLETLSSLAEAEKALRASETVVNLRRMRPVLAKLWPVWILQRKKFCGKLPEQYAHFKEFELIPDDALESAIRWLSREPLVFTGTKKLVFESLPEKLTMIPDCIAEMPLTDLEYVSFDGNEISFLPVNCFQKSTGLKSFTMIDNLLQAIPENLTETWRIIEVLHFSNNQLRAIPKKLGYGCLRLKTLMFGSNAISVIPVEFVAVLQNLVKYKLKVFDVSHNCLEGADVLTTLASFLRDPSSQRIVIPGDASDLPEL